jgi:hypothetical protein
MPHNWTLAGGSEKTDPPVIRAGADGALYVQLAGSYGVVIEEEISWVAEERALVGPGQDAYPTLDLLFHQAQRR